MTDRPRLHVVVEFDRPVELALASGEMVVVDDRRIVRAVSGYDAPPGRHVIRLDGRRIDRRSPARRVAAGLGVVDDAPVTDDVSVRDHLAAIVSPTRAEELLSGCRRLAGRGDDPAGWLSGGERRVLAWLVCHATGPLAVVLDGAFRGLDPEARAWAEGVLAAWLDRGVAVLRHDPA